MYKSYGAVLIPDCNMDWRFVLVLAFGITNSERSLDRAYSPNREYVYEYEAQTATGMPEGSNFYSGLKIKCQTRFQFQTISRVTMKLEQVRLYKLNTFVEDEDPTKEQLSGYEEITGDEAEWMSKYLIKPVTFKYMRGHVQDIKGENDDEFWSINVKKGVLSLLEMNFEERRSSSKKERLVELNRDRSSPVDYYKVMEPSVVGDCETSYYIETDIPKENDKYMYLTKVRNYQNCLERPVYVRSIFNAMRCAQCESERTEPLKSGSQVRYVMKGDKRRFMVYSAIAESQHVFTPYSPEGGNVATYINQTFVLMDQMDIKRPIKDLESPQSLKKGLQAISRPSEEPESPLTSRPPLGSLKRTPEERKQLIMRYIDMIVAYSKDGVKEEATSLTFTLADELRYADYDMMREIWGQYRDGRDRPNDERFYKWKLILDTLPALGTPASVEVLTEYIMKGEIQPSYAVHALVGLTVTASPDINIAKYLLQLVRDQHVRSHEEVLRTAYLTLGAIADRIRSENDRRQEELRRKERQVKDLKDRENKKHIRDQLDSKLVDIQDEMEQTSNVFSRLKLEIIKEVRELMTSRPEYMIYALKTIGNIGFPDFIPDCKAILEDRSKPQIIRAQAIYSLRKITAFAPEAVRTLLFPYFMDQEEVEEIRIASYLVMTGTNPSRSFMEMLAQSLQRETNPHIGHFVYTHLEQISNSTHPCLLSWARNASFALRYAKKFSPSYQYSQFFHLSSFSERTKMGGAFEMGYVSSPNEFIPRSGAVHANVHVLGYSSNLMEIGFNTEGLQRVVDQLMRSPRKSKDKASVLDILRSKMDSREEEEKDSSEESLRPSKLVSDIHKQLNVSPREVAGTKGHVYLKLFNNEVSYLDIQDWLLESAEKGLPLMQMLSSRGVNFDLYKSAMFMDGQVSWFTELGFPIHYKMRASSFAKVGGSWNLDMALLKQRGLPELKFDLSPSMAMQIRGVVESDFYFFKSGAAITYQSQYDSPLSFSVSADAKKYMFKMNFENMKENFMQSDLSPTFYVEQHFINAQKVPFEDLKYLDHMDGAMVIPINSEYGKYEWGLEFQAKGQIVYRDFDKRLPFYPFYGRNRFLFSIRPGINPPKAADFQFQFTYGSPRASSDSEESLNQAPSESSVRESEEKAENGLVKHVLGYLFGDTKDEQQRLKKSSIQDNADKEVQEREESSSREDNQRHQSKLQFDWYGFEFRLVGVGSKPERWLQCDWRQSLDQSRVIDFKFSRSPFPEKESSEYNVNVKGTFEMPSVEIEPSSLLNPSYQEKIKRQIRQIVQEKPERVKDVLKSNTRQSNDRTIKRPHQNRKELRRLVEDQVERSLKRQDMEPMLSLIVQQKKMSRELKQLSKQRHNVLESSIKTTKVKDLAKDLISVNKEISRQIDSRPQSPEDVLLSVLVLRQQENKRRATKIMAHLNGNLDRLSSDELQDLDKEVRKDTNKLLEKQSDRILLREADRSRSSTLKSLESEQGKVLKDLSKSQTQRLNDQLEKLDDVMKQSLSSLSLDEQRKRQEMSSLLRVMVQHQQILEALKSLEDPIHISKQKSGDKNELAKDDQKLKKLVERLRQRSGAIALVKELRQQQRDEERDDVVDLEKLKRVGKLRLQQLQVAVTALDGDKLRHDQIEKVVEKLEEISRDVSGKADEVRQYSPLVDKLLIISKSQEELLGKIHRKLKDKLKVNLNERIRKDLIQNIETQRKLHKQVESLSKSGVPKSKYVVRKLVSEIQIDQKSMKNLKEARLGDALPEMIREAGEKIKKAVESASKVLDSTEKSKALESIKTICRKQDVLLSQLKDELSQSELQQHQKDLKQLQSKVQEQLDNEKSKQIRVKDSKEKRDREEIRPMYSSDQRDDVKRNYEQREQKDMKKEEVHQGKYGASTEEKVSIKNEIQRLSKEVEKKMQDAKTQREQDKKTESVKNAVKLIKDIVSIVLSHPESPVSKEELESLKDTLEDIRSMDRQSEIKLKSRLLSEIKVLEDKVQESLEIQRKRLDKSSSEEDSFEMQSDKQMPQNGMFFNLDFEFGYQGQTQKYIHIQGISRKSIEQLLWEARQDTLDKDALVQKYLEDRDSPVSPLKEHYKQLKRELNTYRHYDFIAKYNKDDFDLEYRMMWWRFQEFLKYALYRQTWLDVPKDMSNRVVVAFDLRKNDVQADISLYTPYETDRFMGINCPWIFSEMAYRLNRPRDSDSRPRDSPLSVTSKLPGECVLRKQSVKTLDDLVMKLPKTGSCDVVLVMDCSSSPKFSVRARQDDTDSRKKVITLDAESRKVEVVKDDKPKVRVDGDELELKEEQLIIVSRDSQKPVQVDKRRSRKLDEQLRKALLIASKEGDKIKIAIPKEGIKIVSSEDEVRVKVSPLHYSQVCGLCGNYDGIPKNDKENPQKLDHRSPSCLVADLIVPSGQCDSKSIKDQCRKEQPNSPETCKPHQRQVVQTRQKGDKQQICFSEKPVQECKPGCQDVKPRGKVVQLRCLDRDSRQAQILLSQSHHRQLPEIMNLRVPEDDKIKAGVQEPYSCRRN